MEISQKILNFAMQMEKDAADFYIYHLDKIKSPVTKKLFSELSETEKHHYSFLKGKYDELGFSEPPIEVSWVIDKSSDARELLIRSNHAEFTDDPSTEASDLSIIRMAYLIESDVAKFYKNSVEVIIDDEVKKLFKTLADWEVQHKRLLYDKYRKLIKKYWNSISSIIFLE